MNPNQPIRGMLDCEGKEVHEGDIVEFLDWCYASKSRWNDKKQDSEYSPLYGVVKWNTEYFTYEPLIFATDDYSGNCFANVCKYEPPRFAQGTNKVDYPATYFKVIGNVYDNSELLEKFEMTQMWGDYVGNVIIPGTGTITSGRIASEIVDYSYTPCYGTHGNIGKVVGECPKCHQPIYGEQ